MSAVYTPITGNSSYKLVFDDEFNGTSLDTSKWYPPVTQHDNSYSNTNMTEMMAGNVSVHDGVLNMAVTPGPTPDGFQYGTSALTTRGTTIAGEPINVYWEARIENMDNAYGFASDFWTDTAPNYQYPETDFSEYWQAQSPDQTRQNYDDGNAWVLQANPNYGSDLAGGYHVYGVLWTPTAIKYYIDGVLTAETTTNTDQTGPVWYAILNATAGGGGTWPNSTTQIPNHMYVDYVHVYSAQPGAVAVTPEAGYGGPGDDGTSASGASSTIVLRLSEDAWEGDAQFTVSVDGIQQGGTYTAHTLHSTGDSEVVSLTGNWEGSELHNVDVSFINDAYGGSASKDRNLYVDYIAMNGTTYDNTQAPLYGDGTRSFIIGGTTPTTSGPTDSLTLHLSEDAWQGDAQFNLSIDGKQISTPQSVTALHSLGQAEDFAFTGNLGGPAASHTVGVTFTNDAWGGTPTTDRNLYVNSITYDDTNYASGGTALYSNGTASFSV